MNRLRGPRLAIKRTIDLVGAGTAAILLSPVIVVVALTILIKDGRPILFRQARPGLDGRTFTIYKFRTMRLLRPGEVFYLTDNERLTRLGEFMRRSSLDELPELWNVLRGDMSLVGPRPLLTEYLEKYSPEESRRHSMRPGITGWAAVNGRNALMFKERIKFDVWYVDHWGLWVDARIVGMTLWQVIRRQGVSTTEDLALGFPLPDVNENAASTESSPAAMTPETP